MKRVFTLLFTVLIVLGLAACGNTESTLTTIDTTTSSQIAEITSFPGTWEAVNIEIDGSMFTVDEIKAVNNSFTGLTLVLKDGGKAYANGSLFDWEQTDNGLIIGNLSCYFKDNYICVPDENFVVYLEKTSDSQIITVPAEDSDNVGTTLPTEYEDTSTIPTEATVLVDGMRPEFKEAMDSYEAFYDEYCDFMKKYSETPSDFTLLLEYADMMTKAVEMDAKFEKWDDEEMNDAEMKYYLEVSTRVMQKLVDVMG